MGCQVSKYIGSFCLPDGTADIKLRKGGPAVIAAAVLLAASRCVLLQHGAVWHEAQQQPPDGGCLERESRSELWWRLAPPELPLSSAGVRLKLELHEMLMREGGMSPRLPATLPAGNGGSWRDLLRDVIQSQAAFLMLDCFPSKACL